MGCGSSTATDCQTLTNIVTGNTTPVDITSNSKISYNSTNTQCTINISVCQILNAKYVYGLIMSLHPLPAGITDLKFSGPTLLGKSVLLGSNTYYLSLSSTKTPIVIDLVKTSATDASGHNLTFASISEVLFLIITTDTKLDSVYSALANPTSSSEQLSTTMATLSTTPKTIYNIKIPLPSISGFTNPNKNEIQGYYESNKLVEKEYHSY